MSGLHVASTRTDGSKCKVFKATRTTAAGIEEVYAIAQWILNTMHDFMAFTCADAALVVD